MPSPNDLVWDIRFSGTASIAGRALNAAVFLRGGVPAVIALDGIPTITVSKLFDQFFGPDLTWPGELFDLSLSDSSIFYSYVVGSKFPSVLPPAILNVREQVTGEGLFVATTVSLTLAEHQFPRFSAHITSIRGKGFLIEGDLTAPLALFDPDFLLISGPGFSGGPSLSVRSFNPGSQFILDCAYTLFGYQFIDSKLTVTTDSVGKPPKLAAALKHKGTLGPFTDPELDFTWSKDKGFQVQNFPRIPIPNVVLDFKSLLQKVSQARGCGAMVDLAFKQTIDSSFFVTPKVSTSKPTGSSAADGQVYVVISGYYKISALGTLVASIDLPQLVLSFRAPKEFSFDGIVEQIGKTIVDNGVAVIEQLWNDRTQLAKCLAVFVAQDTMKKLISNMVCDELKQLLEKFETALPEPSGGGSGGGGGGGGGAGGIGAALGDALSALGSLFGGGGCGGGGGGGGGGGQSRAALASPSIVRKIWRAAGVTLIWNHVSKAVGYEVQMVDSNRHVVGKIQRLTASEAETQSTLIAFDPAAVVAGACMIQVKALAGADGDLTDSDFATTRIVKLAPATNLVVSCDPSGEIVTAQWSAVSFATQCNVTVRQLATGKVVASAVMDQPSPDAGGTVAHSFSAAQFESHTAGPYTVSVSSLAGETAIPSDGADAGVPVTMLAAPESANQSVTPGGLQVAWTPVKGEARYRLVITNQDTGAEALSRVVTDRGEGSSGLLQRDVRFDDFEVKTPGRYLASISVLGDALHICSGATTSPNSDMLFGGVGFMQVGTTFIIS